MKIVFVVNNKNNRLAKVLPAIESYCEASDLGTVQFKYTKQKKHAIVLAREAVEAGCDHLIAVGGDGTLHEVVNGVLQRSVSAEENPVIGLLPYGSANDFARTAGITKSVVELVGYIRSGSHQKIDLGKIVLQQSGETRYFINIAGAGMGPEVAKRMEDSSSVFGSSFNYFKQIIKGFLSYRKKEVSCRTDTWHWQGKLLQMAVANGRCFGNAIFVAPDAKIDDGLFQVSIFGNLSIWDYLKNLGKLKKGRKIQLPEVHYHDAKEVILESTESCGIEADGEYVGLVPASITLLPEAISFLLPPPLP